MTMHTTWLGGLLAGLATTIAANTMLAQGATITGTVRNAQGQALQAANVRIADVGASVGTDANGEYRITLGADRVRGQTVPVVVRAIGFVPQSRQVTVTAGSQTQDFTLAGDATGVSEVVVFPNARRSDSRELTFPVQRDTLPTNPFSQHLYPPELIMQNQSRLRITEAQRNAILQEIYKVQATAAQVQWRVAEESEKLNQLLERDAAEAEVISQAERMMTWEIAVKRAQLSMLIRVRNLLTPEQRGMLRDLRRRD